MREFRSIIQHSPTFQRSLQSEIQSLLFSNHRAGVLADVIYSSSCIEATPWAVARGGSSGSHKEADTNADVFTNLDRQGIRREKSSIPSPVFKWGVGKCVKEGVVIWVKGRRVLWVPQRSGF